MAEAVDEYPSCAVCGRSILRGERTVEYVAPDQVHVPVCVLCMPRAEASAWLLAGHEAVAVREPAARRRAGAALLERFSLRTGDRAEAAEPSEAPEPPRPRGAIEVFNASNETRRVSGLRRSLGEPRVSLRPGGAGEEVITVAWELCWYQWSVEGERIRQVAKGNEISELPITDRAWTATAAEDGHLKLV